MTAGRLPRPWISGYATTVARMLPEEQPPCRRYISHLDVGDGLPADENELDVLREIFRMRVDHNEPLSYTFHNVDHKEVCGSSFCVHVESCAHARNLSRGMLLHHHIIFSGLENSSSLCDRLARMYGRCNSYNDAFYCFYNIGDRSSSLWNLMVGLQFEQKRDDKTGVQLFQNSLQCNALPHISTLLILISSCKSRETLMRGRQVHALVKSMGCETDVAVGTALLSMYSRCGNFQEAWMLFHKAPEKSIVTWNAMLAACIGHDNAKVAIQLFMHMQQEGLLPNIITLVSAASACARELDISTGKSVHVQAISRGLDSNASLAAAFVSMYGKYGSIENSDNVFLEAQVPCVVLWTAILTVYCQHGYTKKVTYIYKQMQETGILPNEVTFLCILSACNSNDLVTTAKRIHAQISCSGIELNTAMSTALAGIYGKFGFIEESDQLFSSLPQKSVIAWNMMILMCADSGQSNKGIQIFSDMLQQGISPDKFTFVNVLHVCACSLSTFEGKKVHMHVSRTDFGLDVVVCNVLINMYSKGKLLSLARMVFDGMHLRNTLTWNSLIAAYAQTGYHEKALLLFSQMQGEGMCPDAITFASVLSASAQRGRLADCWSLHTEIIRKGFDVDPVIATIVMTTYGRYGHLQSAELVFHRTHERDDNLWNAYITLLGQHDSLHAFQILDDMRNQAFIPSSKTLASSFSASCSSSYPLARVRQLHVSILLLGMEVHETQLCILICAYAECGDLQKTWSLFSVPKCSRMLCKCMVGALAEHGKGRQALELLKEMKQCGNLLDEVSLLSLLSACNHSGLVEDAFGLVMYLSSCSDSLLAVFHCDCIINLLGRVGQLNEVMFFIKTMPFKPTVLTWTSLLGSCTYMLDMQHGQCGANYLLELSKEGFVSHFALYRKLNYFEENLQERL